MKYRITDKRIKEITPNKGDAGIDIRACIDRTLIIDVGEQALIDSGLQVAIPEFWVGKVYPRSGLGTKKGAVLANTVGIIDSIYRGNVLVMLKNKGKEPLIIEPMDRIVQMVVVPHYDYSLLEEVRELSSTERGSGGFGSTGEK